MGEWRKTSLGDTSKVIAGFAFKGKHFGNNGTPVIKIKDILPPFVDTSGAMRVDIDSNYVSSKLDKYKVGYGDFILAMTGATIGKIGKITKNGSFYINQRVAKVLPNVGVDKYFIYYSINSTEFQKFIQNNIDSHSAQENISASSIENFPLGLPPYPEQKAIAGVLSSLDDKIDLLHRQNKTLESMAEALFRHRFIDNAQPDWEKVTLSSFIKPQKGKNITKATVVDGPYPVIAGGLQASCYHNACNTKAPVITVSASGANAGYTHLHHMPVWSSDSSYIDESITPYVYFFYVFMRMNQNIITDKQEGSAQPHIYPSHLELLELYNYPLNLIEEFNNECSPLFEKVGSNLQQISTLEKLRNTLLPKLMSGEVRVEYKEAS